jgi:hypothetical protein
MKLPNRVFDLIERVYFTEKSRRAVETRRGMERYERLQRWWYALDRAQHSVGQCGGRITGCHYRPCYVVE